MTLGRPNLAASSVCTSCGSSVKEGRLLSDRPPREAFVYLWKQMDNAIGVQFHVLRWKQTGFLAFTGTKKVYSLCILNAKHFSLIFEKSTN